MTPRLEQEPKLYCVYQSREAEKAEEVFLLLAKYSPYDRRTMLGPTLRCTAHGWQQVLVMGCDYHEAKRRLKGYLGRR